MPNYQKQNILQIPNITTNEWNGSCLRYVTSNETYPTDATNNLYIKMINFKNKKSATKTNLLHLIQTSHL